MDCTMANAIIFVHNRVCSMGDPAQAGWLVSTIDQVWNFG